MVKLPPQSETTNDWYEGSTAEEAVHRARQSLGNDAPVRCWKVRRGGLFGFFSTEVYIAGVEVPKEVGHGNALGPKAASSLNNSSTSLVESNVDEIESPQPTTSESTSITALVEATSDEVTLGPSNIFESAFIDVLTQAQEALNGRQASVEKMSDEAPWVTSNPTFDVPHPVFGASNPNFDTPRPTFDNPRPNFDNPRPTFDTPRPNFDTPRPTFDNPRPNFDNPRPNFDNPRPTFDTPRPVFDAPRPIFDAPRPIFDTPRPTSYAPLDRRHAPDQSPGMRALAADFGLPSDYWPDGADATLNDLMAMLDRLPAPRPVPCDEGAVIVVVGAQSEVMVTAQRLVQILGLTESDLIEGECTAESRQRILRSRPIHVTVVTIEWPKIHGDRASVAAWIDLLDPDYVIAAVSATSKRADVRDWCHQLSNVNALSLTRTSETTSPGELLGDFPILLVDGHLASTLRWVSMLLGIALERQ